MKRIILALAIAPAVWGAPLAAQDARTVDCEEHLEKTLELINDLWAFYIFKPGFDLHATAESLRPAATEALSPDACADVLDRFVATLGDGHANLTRFPGRTPRTIPEGIRLRRYKDRMIRPGRSRPDQRLYVTEIDTTAVAVRDIPLGSQVLEIDGRPASAVLDSVQLRVSGSTPWNREHWTDEFVLRGPAGSEVMLKVRTPAGEVREFSLTRMSIPADEDERERAARTYADTVTLVEWKRLESDIGYIRFTSFYYLRGVKEFDDALDQLRDTKALVLDMRSNGGGRVDVLQDLVGRFFSQRRTPIAQLLIRWPPGSSYINRSPERMVASRRKWTYEKPVVLLVDAGCFSACDLFANAMDENERALIIGSSPTGGGSASPVNWGVIPSFDGVSVRASYMVAMRQDGEHIENNGIRPHVIVEPTLEDWMARRDPLLDRAVRAIESGEAKPLAD